MATHAIVGLRMEAVISSGDHETVLKYINSLQYVFLVQTISEN